MGAEQRFGEEVRARGRAARELLAEVSRELRPVAAPAFILVFTVLATLAGVSLPASLAGLKSVGPYSLLILAAVLAVWFNRGRPFIIAATLLGAYAAYSLTLESQLRPAAVFATICVLVPLNILLTAALAEHSFFHRQNVRWLLIAVAEILFVAWAASAGRADLAQTGWLEHWLLRSPPTPILGRLMFVAAFTLALMRAWPKPPATHPLPLDLALVSVLIAFFFACEWAVTPGAYSAFVCAGAVLLLLGMLQEFYRLAFRDELTGLPGRRALDERLRGLGGAYALAMVDVDHFKQFNDTHGHHIGDQVLKLVAARLAEVGGGGTAYRYGGEEFLVLFPDQSLEHAQPHLEAIRASIQGYRMAVRSPDRPRDLKQGTALRSEQPPHKTLSVTVSMGLAERSEDKASTALVIKAADEALYRAKGAGRNRLSR